MKVVEQIKNSSVVVAAPSSKAHTLRAIIIASLAKGQSVIHRPLMAADQQNVIRCLRSLGIAIDHNDDQLVIEGGGGVFKPAGEQLDVGESGVGMNFLSAACNLSSEPVILTGAKRITERPIGEVINGLRQLGCNIQYINIEGFPPIRIAGGGIPGGNAKIHGAKTSQYFSSIIISAPYAKQPVTLECLDEMTETPYLDISIEMMQIFGVQAENKNYKRMTIPNDTQYQGTELTIEGDFSSAAFFFLAAAVCQSEVTVTGLNRNSKQGDKAFLDLIAKMGCEISWTDDAVTVRGKPLSAIEQDMSNLPDLVPALSIAAAAAKGTSRLRHIGHLRHKECDRLGVMAELLQKTGIKAACDEDSLSITGHEGFKSAIIDPHNDHRMAMSFAVASLPQGNIQVKNPGCVSKSFPDFWERLAVFQR